VALLGPNAHGELLELDRVPDCYLGLLLRADDPDQPAGGAGRQLGGVAAPHRPPAGRDAGV
jgi:hypothetical protein